MTGGKFSEVLNGALGNTFKAIPRCSANMYICSLVIQLEFILTLLLIIDQVPYSDLTAFTFGSPPITVHTRVIALSRSGRDSAPFLHTF